MSEYENRYKRPHQYRSKLVVDGTVDKVKQLKAEKSLLPRLEALLENHGSKCHKFTTKALRKDINCGII